MVPQREHATVIYAEFSHASSTHARARGTDVFDILFFYQLREVEADYVQVSQL